MFSVANPCHYNENFKNGKHSLQANARPSGAAPTNPLVGWVGANFWCKSPWGARGWGMVMDEIGTCIRGSNSRQQSDFDGQVFFTCFLHNYTDVTFIKLK